MLIDRRFIAQFDWFTLSLVFLIAAAGLVILYSAGYESEATSFSFTLFDLDFHSPLTFRQSINFSIGLVVMLVGILLSPRLLFHFALPIFLFGLVLLLLVLLFGDVANGAKRWIAFGSLRLQPAEYMKFATIIFLARILSKLPITEGAHGIKALILSVIILGLPFFMILVQPDLGTALALGAVGAGMILFAGVRWQILVLAALLPLLALTPISLDPYRPAVIQLLKPYQQRRVMALVDPASDLQGSGWHIHQSKIAVGSGRLFGKGFLQGSQSQLRFLPEHTTDFIFSVLAEEWGFFGCLLVLGLYSLLIYRILYIAGRSRDLFMTYIAFGVAMQVFVHVLINVAMVIGLLPVVGLPLPLLSYGGSSMVTTMFAIGLALGVAMRRSIALTSRSVLV